MHSNATVHVIQDKKEVTRVRLANEKDANQITRIYRDVYKGTYVYKEFTDPRFIMEEIEDENVRWYVIEETSKKRRVIGCVSAIVDPLNLRAYSRGMMIRPKWQGRRGASRSFGIAFNDFVRHHMGKIRLIWSETRSASVKPQRVCEAIGLTPLGLMPWKDIFFNQRESPILMGVYSSSAWKTRDTNITIVPELVPLKTLMNKLFRPMKKDKMKIVEDLHFDNPRNLFRLPVKVKQEKKKYGYCKYYFTCQNSRETVSITVNNNCLNAEHLEISCENPGVLNLLLLKVKDVLVSKGIKYMQGYCPADNPGFQKAFLKAGFKPFGYMPARSKGKNGLHVDEILFGWTRWNLDLNMINLTQKATSLVNVLFNLPRQQSLLKKDDKKNITTNAFPDEK
ncbi:MAG: GNAT family N-acetyltransferase [Promethearchaeota archaeon]